MRALEVTMTVPGAVELIAGLAPSLPAGFILGAGTVTDAETATRVIDAGARFVVSPVFRRAIIETAHARNVPALPGLLLADRDAGCLGRRRRHRQGLPGDRARPRLPARPPRPDARRQAHADRRRDDRQRGRVDRGWRRGARRRQRRCSTVARLRRAISRPSPATPHGIVDAVQRARRPSDAKSRDVRRDHAAAEPAGLRALLPVARPLGHLRRRRGQRGGQPRPLRPRELVSSPACPPHADRRGGRQARCAPRACAPTPSCAAATASASTSPRRAPASAPRRSSTTGRTRPSANSTRTTSTGRALLDGASWLHVTGITPALGAARPPARAPRRGRARRRRAGQRRSELPKEALDRGRRPQAGCAARGRAWTSSSPTRKTCRRARRRRSPMPT